MCLRTLVNDRYFYIGAMFFQRFVVLFVSSTRNIFGFIDHLFIGQFVCVFNTMLPLLFGVINIHLLRNEAYGSILIEPFHLIVYTSIIVYFTPYILMSIFYVRIVRKIRQSSVIRLYQE
jgi:hypothetical protein